MDSHKSTPSNKLSLSHLDPTLFLNLLLETMALKAQPKSQGPVDLIHCDERQRNLEEM